MSKGVISSCHRLAKRPDAKMCLSIEALVLANPLGGHVNGKPNIMLLVSWDWLRSAGTIHAPLIFPPWGTIFPRRLPPSSAGRLWPAELWRIAARRA